MKLQYLCLDLRFTMDLILDFGNTNQKIALFDAGGLVWVKALKKITLPFIRNIVKHYSIDACILSSVVGVPPNILSFLEQSFRFTLLEENTPLPIRNFYQTPQSLGKDRLAAAVEGVTRFPGHPVLIINAGTAITYDVVSAKGEYFGGAISPGMQMRFQALHTFTKQLPLLTFSETDFLTGKNTDQSVLSGVINGIAAEIEGMAAGFQKEYPGIRVILSGGDLNYFVNRLKISIFALPNIVIYGLQKILAFNDKKPM